MKRRRHKEYDGLRTYCGTPLLYEYQVLELIPPILGSTCKILYALTRPVERLYVRVVSSNIDVEKYLELLEAKGFKFYRDEEIPEAIWAPVEGPLEVPVFKGKVIADKRASESVLLGSDLYAPGVISASGFRRGDHVTIYSENKILVGAGKAVMDPGEMITRNKGLAVRVTYPKYRSYRVRELPGYDKGYIYGQSISSMYVASLVDLRAGQILVDLTAAPGGKVTHIAQRSPSSARIIAIDRPSKIDKLKETIIRLGLEKKIEIIGADSRRITSILSSLKGKVDYVLVDPPCSNLGVRPKVYDRRTTRDIRNMVLYQRGFIREAYSLLKPGGFLVYSTCTLTSPENLGNIYWAQERYRLELVKVTNYTRPKQYNGTLWFNPLDGIPGFFIALLRKY